MINSVVSLHVPVENDHRLEIRKKVDLFFQENEIFPPVTYNILFDRAGLLLEIHHWEEKYRAFIMICCNNAIWRKVVGAIPFHRRIFLLPQCLKFSGGCMAETDELGLLCRECGKCSISNLLHEAENLGYVALVTEGTTVTTRLIESGKVDAVIGVGCMEALQKLFTSVSKYSIPGIGIPLLGNGCQDTISDSDWIKNEISYFQEDKSIHLLNLNHLKNKTQLIFSEEKICHLLGSLNSKTERIALESLLSGGQRLRPFIAVLAYESFCIQPDSDVLNRLALSVECFHKASLIHDDIEDKDDIRYGKETIHARYGIAVAINTGDLLIGEGYRLISESNLSAEKISECLKIISQGHRNLAIGQGTELIMLHNKEILLLDDILNVFKNKTSAAFKVSLLLGSILGGADKESISILDKFSDFTGIAYQIKDDLEDYKKDNSGDQILNSSVLLSVLARNLIPAEQEQLQKQFLTGNKDAISKHIENYGIKNETETLLHEYIDNAKKSLENFSNLGLKIALHEILGKIFEYYI